MNRMDVKAPGYVRADVRAFYHCLGHRPDAYTEFRAIDLTGNKHPVVRYVQDSQKLELLVEKTHRNYMPCVGINERANIQKNNHGYPVASKERDIKVSQNVLLDFDSVAKNHSELLQAERDRYFQNEFSDYCQDLGFLPASMLVFSGNGNHAFFSYRPIQASEHADVSARLKNWMAEVAGDQKDELDRLELKLDTSTADLCRVVKIPGTAKPGDPVSRLIHARLQEDEALRDYLLSMPMEHSPSPFKPVYGATTLIVYDQVPVVFDSLLQRDKRLRDLWEGRGKSEEMDTSGSGYDLSLVRRAMILGIQDISMLATILAHRPNGSVRNNGKGEEYLRRTIAKALTG